MSQINSSKDRSVDANNSILISTRMKITSTKKKGKKKAKRNIIILENI